MNPNQKRERDRERWKLAKRAQRAKAKAPARLVSDEFKKAVFMERDRRSKIPWRSWMELDLRDPDAAFRRSRFLADVWAARTILEAEIGKTAVGPTRIAEWLWDQNLHGHYAKSSIRMMVHRASKLISKLEQTSRRGDNMPFWPPFDPSSN